MNENDERLKEIEQLLRSQKKVLNIDEAVMFTGLKKNTLYRLTSDGKIPFSKPNGKKIYFDRVKLEEWLLQNPK